MTTAVAHLVLGEVDNRTSSSPDYATVTEDQLIRNHLKDPGGEMVDDKHA